MKIQHWAIIFLIIILPFSIVCRNVIKKKILVLNDEVRYNNIIDNATYDAVSQIKETSGLFMRNHTFSKNVPLNEFIVNAAIDRFFNTLCVNFNLPTGRKQAESYFGRYIPAIIIIGYDGLYVYSCEVTSAGYEFKLKPKIPYAYTTAGGVLINFTLDNYVKIFVPTVGSNPFAKGYQLADGSNGGTNIVGGYVGEDLDLNNNGLNDMQEPGHSTTAGAIPGTNPYGLGNNEEKDVKQQLATYVTDSADNNGNLSYFLYYWWKVKGFAGSGNIPANLSGLLITDFTSISISNLQNGNLSFAKVNRDYQYDDNNKPIAYGDGKYISEFHRLRRETIINTIVKTLRQEFNEHNAYAHAIGVTYDFQIPNISRDEWNNSIDDVSILSFIQGLPMGSDMFYNNYSLGGARIVQRDNVYCEFVRGTGAYNGDHRVYHKYYCPYIPRDANGNIVGSQYNQENIDNIRKYQNGTVSTINYEEYTSSPKHQFPDNSPRRSSGIVDTALTEQDAMKKGFYPCRECCISFTPTS